MSLIPDPIKELCAYLLLIVLLTFSLPPAMAGSILIDLDSRQQILEENINEKVESTDITSLMAVFSVLEYAEQNHIDLFTPVKNPWVTPLEATEGKLPLASLLQILLLNSSTTVLHSIPTALGLNTEAFDDLMNANAFRLGMRQSSFHLICNRSDLCQTSAQDIAHLSLKLIALHPNVLLWAQQKELYIPEVPTQKNSNFFLGRSQAVRGLFIHSERTANAIILTENETTDGASPRRLLAIDIGSPNQEQLQERLFSLFQRGWQDFATVCLYKKGEQITLLPVHNGTRSLIRTSVIDDLFVTLSRERLIESGTSSFAFRVRYSSPLTAPISQGTPLGVLEVLDGDTVLCSASLVASENISKGGFWTRFIDKLRLSSR